jgi:hypothetical protein
VPSPKRPDAWQFTAPVLHSLYSVRIWILVILAMDGGQTICKPGKLNQVKKAHGAFLPPLFSLRQINIPCKGLGVCGAHSVTHFILLVVQKGLRVCGVNGGRGV